MKVVVDEGVPFRLAAALRSRGIDVADFVEEWRGLQNGALLDRLKNGGFDCLLTCDKNLRHQQNLQRRKLAVVVLPKSRFADLVPFLGAIVSAIEQCERGRAFVISADGQDAFD